MKQEKIVISYKLRSKTNYINFDFDLLKSLPLYMQVTYQRKTIRFRSNVQLSDFYKEKYENIEVSIRESMKSELEALRFVLDKVKTNKDFTLSGIGKWSGFFRENLEDLFNRLLLELISNSFCSPESKWYNEINERVGHLFIESLRNDFDPKVQLELLLPYLKKIGVNFDDWKDDLNDKWIKCSFQCYCFFGGDADHPIYSRKFSVCDLIYGTLREEFNSICSEFGIGLSGLVTELLNIYLENKNLDMDVFVKKFPPNLFTLN